MQPESAHLPRRAGRWICRSSRLLPALSQTCNATTRVRRSCALPRGCLGGEGCRMVRGSHRSLLAIT
jgi:hypothetical protein